MTIIRHTVLTSALLSLLFAGCSGPTQPAGTTPSTAQPTTDTTSTDTPASDDPHVAAVQAKRDPRDTARDDIRKPLELLRFLDVKPGMRVAELGAGGGYTTSLIAHVVGTNGKVYAQNPKEWAQYVEKPWQERTTDGRLAQVTLLTAPFDAPLPADATNLDMVVSVLIYHDTANMPVDRAAMNKAVAAALAPDGIYAIVDHHAADGAGTSGTKSIHRIEKKTVVDEVLAAGFELVEEADFLRDTSDDHTGMAYGKPQPLTDRFVLKFKKSAGQ